MFEDISELWIARILDGLRLTLLGTPSWASGLRRAFRTLSRFSVS